MLKYFQFKNKNNKNVLPASDVIMTGKTLGPLSTQTGAPFSQLKSQWKLRTPLTFSSCY